MRDLTCNASGREHKARLTHYIERKDKIMAANDTRHVELKFNNRTARTTSRIGCEAGSVADILQWYGSHYAGDDYTVYRDGEKIDVDQNGVML